MRSKFFPIILVCFIVMTSCNSEDLLTDQTIEDDKIIELNNKIIELNDEIKELKEINSNQIEEVDILYSQIEDMNVELTTSKLSSDEELIIKLADEFNGRIGQNDNQPIQRLAIWKSEEPIRILPSINASFIYNDKLTYDIPDDCQFESVVEVYDSVLSEGQEWVLINDSNFTIGYVLKNTIIEYSDKELVVVEVSENFEKVQMGTTVDEIMNMYHKRTQLINARNGYNIMIQVKGDGVEEINSRYDMEIGFYFDDYSRRINFIQTTSDKYSLESGYKVGDSTKEVFDYYDSKYKQIDAFSSTNYRRYDIGNGYSLDIGGDLEENGTVYIIIINGGYNIYV